MDRGPLPPHERTWRHPSEVAAAERAVARSEAAAPSTRMFALTTGTVGLLAVGVLIVTVTPQRQDSPIALSATTTIATLDSGDRGARLTESIRPQAAVGVSTLISRPAAAPADVLATPIGDGRLAVVTAAAAERADAGALGVRFASGRVGAAQIVASDRDVVVVELDEAEPGHAIARAQPAAADVVVVMSSPPITIAFADVDSLDVHEGTPVLDGDGHLVGLCSRRHHDGPTELMAISEELADATTAGR